MQFNKFLSKTNILYVTGSLWGMLGYKRGINNYEYEYSNNQYNKMTYLYIDKISYGIYGICLYINPILLPMSVYKEVYRLEINMRKLESEKKSKYYNLII